MTRCARNQALWRKPNFKNTTLAYFAALSDCGYEPSDVETAALGEIEAALAGEAE